MNGVYNPLLVVLSILVAIFASYTALDLANSVALARGRARLAWLFAGALAMGVGIWSMHFVGMLAFQMPGMSIAYDVPLMLLSVVVAVGASGLALFVVSRSAVALRAHIAAAFAMGAAIAGMHYIGIWSMRMAATIEWNALLVSASIAIAVGASFVALALALRFRFDRTTRGAWIRVGGGVVMGLAIAGMHYTAMAAAHFMPTSTSTVVGQNLLATDALAMAVTGATLVILAVAIAGSAITRELTRRNLIASESTTLYREAEGARQQAEEAHREAEALARTLQEQTAHLEKQATELATLNEQLTTSEERLRGIIDSALDAMVVTDEHSVIIEWNRHAATTFGWSSEEAIGRQLADTIIPERYREPHRRGVARYLATGEVRILNRRVEITALRRDGTEFPIELTISPVRSANRVLFTSFMRDITLQKQAEEQRRDSERREQMMKVMEQERSRLSALFEQAPAFIAFLQGPEHVFQLRNARYDQFVGHRDILGKSVRDALPELASQGYVDLLDSVYRSGQPHVGVGARLVMHSDNGGEPKELYINFVYQPLVGVDGTTTGIFFHGVDVTEIVRARQEAESASRAKNEFLSRMSHELRTPLNAILGFGQLLELEAVTPDNRESADQIVRAGKHLLSLIDEVLDIARIEGGHISLSVGPVNVARVLQESVALIRDMAAKQNVILHEHEGVTTNHLVIADQQRLKQVMLNLLSNSIKYNRPGGHVTVSCAEREGNQLRIIVADTGYGIPTTHMPRLFTPFDRLGAEQRGVEGAGLGLALSRGLMDAMGGTLGVESVEGEGTRFWVELPIAKPVAETEVAESSEQIGATSEMMHTVLVVEDNLTNVRLMERIFARQPDIKLLTAMQGTLGIELAREHRPGVILLDLNLPDLPGSDVLRIIREDPELKDTTVVMISGDANPTQVQRLLGLGANSYLTKPFEVKELLDLVDGALQRKSV